VYNQFKYSFVNEMYCSHVRINIIYTTSNSKTAAVKPVKNVWILVCLSPKYNNECEENFLKMDNNFIYMI
jgi:hypothetical protein